MLIYFYCLNSSTQIFNQTVLLKKYIIYQSVDIATHGIAFGLCQDNIHKYTNLQQWITEINS